MFSRLCLLLLFCHVALMAQLTNSVTVNASLPAAQPDSVVFSVTVTSGFNATVEDVVNAVSSLGLTAANLISLGVPNPPFNPYSPNPSLRPGPPQEQWAFQLVVPFAQMKSTSAALAKLQKSVTGGLSLSWAVTGTQTSTAASTCNLSDLAAQASTQAQQIATASSVKLRTVNGIMISSSGCSLTASYALNTAQPGQRLLTAIASQPIGNAAPDQVQLDIQVSSPLTATFSSITAALTKAGITGITFGGVTERSQQSFARPRLTWTFTEMIPLAKLASTIAQFTSAGWNLGAGLSLGLVPNGVSYSQPPSCPDASLLSEAQTLANNVAAAAGVNVGKLLSMSSGTAAAVPTAVLIEGDFSSGLLPVAARIPGVPYFTPFVPVATCSLTAQFQLL